MPELILTIYKGKVGGKGVDLIDKEGGLDILDFLINISGGSNFQTPDSIHNSERKEDEDEVSSCERPLSMTDMNGRVSGWGRGAGHLYEGTKVLLKTAQCSYKKSKV